MILHHDDYLSQVLTESKETIERRRAGVVQTNSYQLAIGGIDEHHNYQIKQSCKNKLCASLLFLEAHNIVHSEPPHKDDLD